MYIETLLDILRENTIPFKSYADGTQISVYASKSGEDYVNLTNTFPEIKQWMRMRHLKLNDDKTEIGLLNTFNYSSKEDIVASTAI